MTGRRVVFTRSAEKEFLALPAEIRARFVETIEILARSPLHARSKPDVTRMRGSQNLWRLRVGNYRGIFAVENGDLVFTRFGDRKNLYRP